MTGLVNSKNINNRIPCTLFEPSQENIGTTSLETILPDWPKFTYKINEYGFRYDTTSKDKVICFVGCSITFGVGLAQEHTFPEIVTRSLGDDWQCMNISMPGSGPDVQIINLTWAINNFKIDKIVWYMSDPLRQTTIRNGHLKFHVPNTDNIRNGIKDDELELLKHVVNYEETILLRTYWNLYTLFSLIKEKNIDLYFRCWIDDFQFKLSPLISQFNIKEITNMHNIDIARDNMHSGIMSHNGFANELIEIINEN
jgi:hypothetical protein